MSNSNLSCILKGKIGQKLTKWEHKKYKYEQKRSNLPEKSKKSWKKWS